MKSQKLFTLLFIVGFIVSVFGTAVLASDKDEVIVWMWSAHSREHFLQWYDKYTEIFEREYPGLTVRFEFAGGFGGESLIASVAGGSPPDIYLVNATSAQALYDRGVIMPINQYVEQTPHMTLDNFIPSSTLFGQKDGVVFGLPWSLEARAILYNKDHLLEAGLDTRRESLRTWDDVASYAQRLVRFDNTSRDIIRSGFILGKGTTNFAGYLYANGGEFYNATLDGVAFGDEKGLEVLEIMNRFMNELEVERRGSGSGWSNIGAQTASMAIGDTSSISGIAPVSPDYLEWLDMAPIPQGSYGGEHSSTVTWSNLFVIPNGAKNPDNAWKFIELWLRSDVQEEYFVHFDSMSIRSPRRDFFQTSAFAEAMRNIPYMDVQPEIFNFAKPTPYIRHDRVGAIMGPYITQVQNGEIAPAVALGEMERLANAVFQE